MGSRRDNVTDPQIAAALLLARRGQAYYARKLNELSDSDLDQPSALPGWSRRQLVAHVGLNARALTRLTTWARTGIETPMYSSPNARNEEIEFTATLPAEALRHLSEHAAIHLNVEWRDLPKEAWQAEVRTAQGRTVPASETVWMRTRETWLHAVDLGNGTRPSDFPAELITALLEDVVGMWRRRQAAEDLPDLELIPDDDHSPLRVGGSDDPVIIRGTAAALLGWATGRSAAGVRTETGESARPAPRWL